MNDGLRLLAALLLCLAWAAPLHAAPPPAVLEPGLERLRLAPHVQVLADPAGDLALADVAALPDGAWLPGTRSNLVPGYRPVRAWWLHLRLVRPAAGSEHGHYHLEVGPARAMDVRLFLRRADGRVELMQNGLVVPISERPVPSRRPVFPLALAPGETLDAWIRVESPNAVSLRSRLWEANAWADHVRRTEFAGGLQIGALLLFGLYAFVLFAGTRERGFLWFALSMLAYSAYDLTIHGYAAEYLWPTLDAQYQVRLVGLFFALNVACQAMLLASIVPTRTQYPLHHRTLMAIAALALCTVPVMLLASYRVGVQPLNLLALLGVAASISLAVRALRDGYGPARALLPAYLLVWAVSILQILDVTGTVPVPVVTEYPQSWTMVAVGMLLALAISRRIRDIRDEREAAQQEMLALREQARDALEREVRERTHQLVVARDEAESASRVKSTFLAHMSHELRTPLHAVLGYTGLLLADARDEVTRRRLGAVQRSANHLLALIGELLDYTRGEAGRLRLEQQPVQLRPWLDAVAEEAQAIAGERNARIYLALDPVLPAAVLCDPVRLRQVLLNLLVNAVRHSGGHRIALGARVADAPPGDRRTWLRFSVQDNGSGIAPGERERIFESFAQGRETPGTSLGLGLGLPIARQLVRAMGGDILCEDATGGGTLFHFTLALEAVDTGPVLTLTGPAAGWHSEGPRRRVLVVDDIADNRDLLAEVLGGLGFDCVHAAGAAEALDLLAGGGVDLVITDQVMPGRDGWWLLAEARRRGHGQPFLLLSAAPAEPPAGTDPSLRFDAALLKPASGMQLARTAAHLLGLHWQEAPGGMAGGDSAGQPPPPALPDAARCTELRAMLALGQVTEIEEWLAALAREQPDLAPFTAEVARLLAGLDLPAIERLLGPAARGPGQQ